MSTKNIPFGHHSSLLANLGCLYFSLHIFPLKLLVPLPFFTYSYKPGAAKKNVFKKFCFKSLSASNAQVSTNNILHLPSRLIHFIRTSQHKKNISHEKRLLNISTCDSNVRVVMQT